MERQWTPERWLNLFGTVCVAFHVVLWTVFAAVTPIVTLPPFVDLPHSSSGAASPESEGDAIVSVRRTGETYLQLQQVERPLLADAMARSRRADRTLRLRVDRTTPFAYVREVVAAAQTAGYDRLTIMVRVETAALQPPTQRFDEVPSRLQPRERPHEAPAQRRPATIYSRSPRPIPRGTPADIEKIDGVWSLYYGPCCWRASRNAK